MEGLILSGSYKPLKGAERTQSPSTSAVSPPTNQWTLFAWFLLISWITYAR